MKKDFVVLVLCLLVAGAVSVWQGFDHSWDWANYHLYGPFAFLNGKLGFDAFPAGVQTYINPLIDLPYYLMIKHLGAHPVLITFLLGQSYGLAGFLVYKISDVIFKGKPVFVVFCTVIAMTGALTVAQAGSTMGDNAVAVFVLGAVFLAVKYLFSGDGVKRTRLLFAAGLLLGLGTGLKLTAGVFALTYFLTLCLMAKRFESPWKILGVTAAALALGFTLTGGYWMVVLWKFFKNPFFPYFNDFFKSDLALQMSFTDDRGKPQTLFQWLFYPFFWNNPSGSQPVYIEGLFVDFRYLLTYIAALVIIGCEAIKRPFKTKFFDKNRLHFVVLFAAVSYLVWLWMFSLVRYYMPVCLLSGVIILAAVLYLTDKPKWILLALAVVLLSTTHYSDYHRTTKYEPVYFEDLQLPDNAVVLTAGTYPTAVWAVFQNPRARFFGIKPAQEAYPFKFNDKTEELIKAFSWAKDEQVYLLNVTKFRYPLSFEPFRPYVDVDNIECRQVKTNHTGALELEHVLCKVKGRRY